MRLAQFELAGEIVILPLRLGEDEAAADLEAAFDLLPAHAIGDRVEGGVHLAMDGDGVGRAMALHELGETVLERAADIAGVARRGAVAEILGVEHGDAAPGPRQHEGGVEAGDARADDGDVDRRRRRRRDRRDARRGIPPIGRLLEIGGEDGLPELAHALLLMLPPPPRGTMSLAPRGEGGDPCAASGARGGAATSMVSPPTPRRVRPPPTHTPPPGGRGQEKAPPATPPPLAPPPRPPST